MLSKPDFDIIVKLLYDKSGIVFSDKKNTYIENRVLSHMEEMGEKSLQNYIKQLKYNYDVLNDLVSKVTTNETYFYREFYHLELLSNMVRNSKFIPPFNILSFPTSSGEEPYSIAIVLTEVLGDIPFHITGCDIDKKVLDKAKKGIYNQRSINKLPKPYIQKYFTKVGDEYHICQSIKNKVKLYQGSIIDRGFVRSLGQFHYVFCKNLFIYFDDNSKDRAVNNLYDIMRENGCLFLGHAESLSRTTSLFEPVKLEGTIIYRKLDDEEEE